MVEQANLSAPRGTRIGAFVIVALLHVVAAVGLIRAFAPDFTDAIVERTLESFTVTVTTPAATPTPTPPPNPTPQPRPQEQDREGAAAPAGRKATPKEVVAPRPKIVLAERPAPRASSSGTAITSGARDAGEGTGAGGQGTGTGSGQAGSGAGGGAGGVAASKPVKIAGDINSARDYPAASREARLGDYVIVVMTVGTDGRARDCRVQRASRDPAADAITCRLAEQRFRFKPAVDASGNAVESRYGWRQRWFL